VDALFTSTSPADRRQHTHTRSTEVMPKTLTGSIRMGRRAVPTPESSGPHVAITTREPHLAAVAQEAPRVHPGPADSDRPRGDFAEPSLRVTAIPLAIACIKLLALAWLYAGWQR
jgi:hypothetical protein